MRLCDKRGDFEPRKFLSRTALHPVRAHPNCIADQRYSTAGDYQADASSQRDPKPNSSKDILPFSTLQVSFALPITALLHINSTDLLTHLS